MNSYTKNHLHERFQGDELYHHGILGMHWGIRRYQPYLHGQRVAGGREVGLAARLAEKGRGGDAATVQAAARRALKTINRERRATMDTMREQSSNPYGKGYVDAAFDSYKRLGRASAIARREARPIDVSSVTRPDVSEVYKRLKEGSSTARNDDAVSVSIAGLRQLATKQHPVRRSAGLRGDNEYISRFVDSVTIGSAFLDGTNLGTKKVVDALEGSWWTQAQADRIMTGISNNRRYRDPEYDTINSYYTSNKRNNLNTLDERTWKLLSEGGSPQDARERAQRSYDANY